MKKQRKVSLTKIFNVYITKKFSFNVWILPILLCSVTGGYFTPFFIAYITAFIHEAAHVCTARLLNVNISEIKLYPFGITARLSSSYIRSSEKEFAIAFAGPFANILLFWVSFILKKNMSSDVFDYFTDINLAMCAINLLPALPLDGGRMIKAILTSKYGIIRAYNFMMKLSKIIIISLLSVAIIYFFITDFNFSLILISAFLLQNLCAEQQAISIITLKEILNSRSKLTENREYPVKNLCVSESTPARSLLRHLSYDCYYLIHIIGSDSKILKTVTETEVFSVLTQNGIRTQYKNLL